MHVRKVHFDPVSAGNDLARKKIVLARQRRNAQSIISTSVIARKRETDGFDMVNTRVQEISRTGTSYCNL